VALLALVLLAPLLLEDDDLIVFAMAYNGRSYRAGSRLPVGEEEGVRWRSRS